jgi:hypothetical protein
MYTFTVNDANTIEVFAEGQEAPTLRQPYYPNQEAFESKAAAKKWAKLFIASMEDETAPFAPIGKGIPGEPRPTKEQILEMLKKQAEEYGDNVPEQLAKRISDLEAELAA